MSESDRFTVAEPKAHPVTTHRWTADRTPPAPVTNHCVRIARLLPFTLTVAALTAVSAVPAAATPGADRDRQRPPASVSLPDGLRPEGITSAGTRYFVGSLADGRIVTGDLVRPRESTVLLPGASGRQVRGLFYDARTKLVWAAGNVGTTGHVWAVSARSGRVVTDTVVPGSVFLNDLVVTRDAVWVTDSKVERLTRIALDKRGLATGTPTYVPLGGAWPGAVTEDGVRGNSANGIRTLDRSHVVLDHSTAGGLWSVDLRTGAATEIPVSGGPAVTGGDGIERRGATLWVVRATTQTSVAQLRLSVRNGQYRATWQRLLTDPTLDVPSTATFAAGSLYAVNARFGTPSPDTATYSITRL